MMVIMQNRDKKYIRTVGIPANSSNGKISTREICRVLRDEFDIGHIMVARVGQKLRNNF